jgi:hypothetical protein
MSKSGTNRNCGVGPDRAGLPATPNKTNQGLGSRPCDTLAAAPKHGSVQTREPELLGDPAGRSDGAATLAENVAFRAGVPAAV